MSQLWSPVPSSEITSKSTYLNRRRFLTGAAGAGLAGLATASGFGINPAYAAEKLITRPGKFSSANEAPTPYGKVTTYNNYYEFGRAKDQPAKNAGGLRTHPWTVSVEGLVQKPLKFDVDTLRRFRPLEERIYRFRCVEAWSMVIPWDGYSLSEFIKACNPLSKAKYVQFLSLRDPDQMPLLGSSRFNSAYSEGLRMDEAMHPLTLLTFGVYGEALPNQNGAPVRVIVPWKYGFKSAKSIVTVRFLAEQPNTTWSDMTPSEYGFYSNVNPSVDHPRWTQSKERHIGSSFLPQMQPTQPFNGYANEVASLYSGMDLKKYY